MGLNLPSMVPGYPHPGGYDGLESQADKVELMAWMLIRRGGWIGDSNGN